MFWLKACARCGGDVYKQSDMYGEYLACIQCGTYLTEAEQTRLGVLTAQRDQLTLEEASSQRLAA